MREGVLDPKSFKSKTKFALQGKCSKISPIHSIVFSRTNFDLIGNNYLAWNLADSQKRAKRAQKTKDLRHHGRGKTRDGRVFRDRKNWSDNIAKKQEIWVRLVECYIHKFIGNSFYQAVMLPDSPLQSPNRQSSVMRMGNVMSYNQQFTADIWSLHYACCFNFVWGNIG